MEGFKLKYIYLLDDNACLGDGYLYVLPDYIFTVEVSNILCDVIDHWHSARDGNYTFNFNEKRFFSEPLEDYETLENALLDFMERLKDKSPNIINANIGALKYLETYYYY